MNLVLIFFTIYFSKDTNWLSMLKEIVIKSPTSTKQKKLEKKIDRLRFQDAMNNKVVLVQGCVS